MNQENASTNVDLSGNTPQWLIDCKKDEAGKYDIREAWTAAVKAAHGEVYGKLNPMHRGINATLADAKKYFEEAELPVPNDARTSVTEFIWKCIPCQKSRKKADRTTLPRNSLHGHKPFQVVQMDFLEGIGPSGKEEEMRKKKKGEYPNPTALLVIIDSFTRFTRLFPVYDKSADTVRRCLHVLYCSMGIPGVTISDGGPAFASKDVENFLKAYGSEQTITHPHLPTAHGLVERVNKKTLDYLKMLLNQVREMEFEEWHYAIPMVEYIVNTTTHSVTGYAPCTLIFGTQSVEDLQMMSKQGLEMEKLEAD